MNSRDVQYGEGESTVTCSFRDNVKRLANPAVL